MLTNHEKIVKFFTENKTKFDFLMFPPGAGGEYFSGIISLYSSNYATNTFYKDYGNNKFIASVPKFFKIVANMCPPGMHPTTIDYFANQYIIDSSKYHEFDLDTELRIAQEFLRVGKRLVRTHLLSYDFITHDNAYEIYPDSEEWAKYCNYLKVIKALSKNIDYTYFCNITITERCREIKNRKKIIHPKYKEVVSWLTDNRDIDILEGHAYLIQYYNEFNSFDEIFKLTASDMIEFFYDNPNLALNPMHHIEKYTVHNTHNIIPMSKMFNDRSFLATMFDINSEGFNEKVQKWHRDNLQILKKYNIDW